MSFFQLLWNTEVAASVLLPPGSLRFRFFRILIVLVPCQRYHQFILVFAFYTQYQFHSDPNTENPLISELDATGLIHIVFSFQLQRFLKYLPNLVAHYHMRKTIPIVSIHTALENLHYEFSLTHVSP